MTLTEGLKFEKRVFQSTFATVSVLNLLNLSRKTKKKECLHLLKRDKHNSKMNKRLFEFIGER
jgi:hypothetical protein